MKFSRFNCTFFTILDIKFLEVHLEALPVRLPSFLTFDFLSKFQHWTFRLQKPSIYCIVGIMISNENVPKLSLEAKFLHEAFIAF